MLVSDTTRTQSLSNELLLAPELSIIIPAYNEEKTISTVIDSIRSSLSTISRSYDLLVVDDGSTDRTLERLSEIEASSDDVRVIHNPRNSGKGAAVKLAARFIRGASVVVIDSDGEINSRLIADYVRGLRTFDVCIASKRHPQSVYQAPLSRKFMSIAFNKMVRLMTGVALTDTQTGLKAAKGEHFTKIMKATSVKRYAYDVEFLAIADLLNLRVAELPVHIHQNSMFDIKAVMYMFVDLLGISYRLRIKKWYKQCLEQDDTSYKPILQI